MDYLRYAIGIVIIAMVFRFGGDVFKVIFNVGNKLGKAIGDVFWKS